MSFRKALAAGICALALASAAEAQSIESGGLAEINPWNVGYISRSEGAFADTLWSGSRPDDLVPLMQFAGSENDTRLRLTPVEHNLLRRVLLSPGQKPEGETDGLITERIRLLRALGEIEPAIDLMRKSGIDALALEADQLTRDMALARGDVESACAGADRVAEVDAYALKLRALCFALAGDDAATELAVDFAANEGVDDDWFYSALLATLVDTPSKPDARLNDGLSIAASLAAGLEAPADAMVGVAPHYALALARRSELPAEWRVVAAGVAAEAGLLNPKAVRDAFADLNSDPEYVPGSALERAMQVLGDDTVSPVDRAVAYADALRSAAGRPERFAGVSAVLAPGIEALPKTVEMKPRAVLFARAALSRGDVAAARAWTDVEAFLKPAPSEPDVLDIFEPMNGEEPLDEAELTSATEPEEEAPEEPVEPEPEYLVDAFDLAMTDGLILLASEKPDPASVSDVSVRIIGAAEDGGERAVAARLFALWSARGLNLSPDARDVVGLTPSDDGARLPDGEAIRLSTLTGPGLGAELVFRVLAVTDGHPNRLGTRDAALVVKTLQEAGLARDARLLALEAMAYWTQ